MRRTALIISLVAGSTAVFSCHDPLRPPIAPPGGPRAAAAPTGGVALQGNWSPPTTWPIVAAHLAVLPDGRVMTWVSSDQPGDVQRHEVHVWDPATGVFTDITAGVHNAFCAAEVFLGDGRLLVAGGHISDNKGLKQAATFDWRLNAWQSTADMRAGRWYPTSAPTLRVCDRAPLIVVRSHLKWGSWLYQSTSNVSWTRWRKHSVGTTRVSRPAFRLFGCVVGGGSSRRWGSSLEWLSWSAVWSPPRKQCWLAC